MKEFITLKTMKEIKIISHPMRMKILKKYYGFPQPATVKQIADHMGEVPANIHYHVMKLLEIGVLTLDHTQVINGIVAKFYKPSAHTIKIEDDDETLDKNRISKYEILVSNFFDENKNTFMKHLNLETDKQNEVPLISTTLHLTKKEYEGVLNYLKSLATNHKVTEENKKSYMFFSGLIEKE